MSDYISTMATMMNPPTAGLALARGPAGVAPPPISVTPPPHYDLTPDLIAAALAGGIIAAGGKLVSAEQAVAVWREVREALGQ